MDTKELADNIKATESKINNLLLELHKPISGYGQIEVLVVGNITMGVPIVSLKINIIP